MKAWVVTRINSDMYARTTVFARCGHWRLRTVSSNRDIEGMFDRILGLMARADKLEQRDPLFAAHTATTRYLP